MIFVTVGTHEQPFNRLVKCIDELVKNAVITEDVIIQTGFTEFVPQYCQSFKLLTYQEMVKNMEKAKIIITHGGPASFVMSLQVHKVPIVVPRYHHFGEHVNNHQVEFVKAISESQNNIIPVYNIDDLSEVILNYNNIIASLDRNTLSNNTKFNEEFEKIVEELMICEK